MEGEQIEGMIWTRASIRTPEVAEGLVALLTAAGPEWAIERFGPHEPLRRRVTDRGEPGLVETLLGRLGAGEDAGGCLFAGPRIRQKARISGNVSYPTRPVPLSGAAITAARRSRDQLPFPRFLGVMTAIFALFRADYGRIYARSEFHALHYDPTVHTFRGHRFLGLLPDIYSGNLLGAFLVERVGPALVASAPGVGNAPLPGGGYYLGVAEDPWDWEQPEVAARRAAVRAHLGPAAFPPVRLI